jgi:hypothetical protein
MKSGWTFQRAQVSNLSNKRAAAVAQEIKESFAGIPYPGDDRLVAGRTPEDDEVADFLRGRGWQDLPLDWLARNHESMFFMTPEALRFYLPAFLIPSILDCSNAGDISGSLLFLFETPGDSVRQTWFQERFGPSPRDSVRPLKPSSNMFATNTRKPTITRPQCCCGGGPNLLSVPTSIP